MRIAKQSHVIYLTCAELNDHFEYGKMTFSKVKSI